jgi:hypothetical protein
MNREGIIGSLLKVWGKFWFGINEPSFMVETVLI